MPRVATLVVLLVIAVGAVAVGVVALRRSGEAAAARGGPGSAAVAVEAAEIRAGVIQDVRQFSGTLEASALFQVGSKASGLLEGVAVDLGDEVERGQVVAEIDDAEYVQAVARAEAELGVRRAELSGAQSALELAQSEFDRSQALKERGIASESQLDATAASLAAARSALALAEAQVQQAEAMLEIARIQLGEADVRASWGEEGAGTGIVAERFVDPGGMIQAGDPIISVATLDPLTAVVFVTERDYAKLRVGQHATLATDALPGREFAGEIARIAPIFREASRQARVELRVDNDEGALRPGMFARVRIVLQEEDAEAIVPLGAVTRRGGDDVVFVLDEEGASVSQWRVRTGISQGDVAQVFFEEGPAGASPPGAGARVVTLGQQLLTDGSKVNVEEGLGAGAWRTRMTENGAGTGSAAGGRGGAG